MFEPLPPSTPAITQGVVTQVRDLLCDSFMDLLTEMDFKVQEDGRLLLVSIGVADHTTVRDALRVLEIVAADVSRTMPKREDGYAWIIAIKYADEVLRSACGGWIGRPDV